MSRSTIPGRLDAAAMQALYGRQRDSDVDANRMRHFDLLTQSERENAIRRMATAGFTDGEISAATKLAIEQVRRVLAVRGTP